MTDGGSSFSNIDVERLKQVRREELHEICSRIGIKDIIHFDMPDGRLALDSTVVDRVAEIIRDKQPDVIYVPFFCDVHVDHVAANLITAGALKKLGYQCEIRAYEVQVPITHLIFNAYFEISEYVEFKREMLNFFKSQTLSFQNIIAAWKVNAAFIAGARNVEVFFTAHSELYEKLVGQFVTNPSEWVNKFYASGTKAKILLTYLEGWSLRKRILRKIQEV
jgi:LmbE family N-acetylglucosaminyl deacetylase